MQKVLCVISIASIFLPWLQVSLFFTSISVNMVTFMIGGGMLKVSVLMALGGAVFLAGSIALLGWKKAPLIQIAGLVILTAGMLHTFMGHLAGLSFLSDLGTLLELAGIGAYVGWGAALAGMLMMGTGWPTPGFVQGISRLLPRGRRAERAEAVPVTYPKCPVVDVPIRAAGIPPTSFLTAIETAEGHLNGGDLSAALTWYGRALGASRDDEERAISKVRIASVLHVLGKVEEARLFIREAKQIDPQDVSGWSMPLNDRSWMFPPRAAEA